MPPSRPPLCLPEPPVCHGCLACQPRHIITMGPLKRCARATRRRRARPPSRWVPSALARSPPARRRAGPACTPWSAS
eukprot:15440820-Alexandrium_andersonii.AAC.1